MKIYNYKDLNQQQIKQITSRMIADDNLVYSRTQQIIDKVKTVGDQALFSYAAQFDKVELDQLFIGKEELCEIAKLIPDSVKNAIDVAYQNIYKFHLAQVKTEDKVETMPGVTCWRETRAIEKVGLYIPGGTFTKHFFNARNSRKNCWLQGNCGMFSSSK